MKNSIFYDLLMGCLPCVFLFLQFPVYIGSVANALISLNMNSMSHNKYSNHKSLYKFKFIKNPKVINYLLK